MITQFEVGHGSDTRQMEAFLVAPVPFLVLAERYLWHLICIARFIDEEIVRPLASNNEEEAANTTLNTVALRKRKLIVSAAQGGCTP